MIARPSIPSTYSPRGMSRRRRPEDAPITISGNDSAGIGNTQSNIARQVIYDNTRTNVHIVLNVEDAKQLSEVKAQGIVQRLNVLTPAYANLVESHKRKSCQQRDRANQLPTPAGPLDQPAIARTQTSRSSSTDTLVSESSKSRSYEANMTPQNLALHKKRIGWMRVILSELFQIENKGYSSAYEPFGKVISSWINDLQRTPALEQLETLLQDRTICDAIMISVEPSNVLKAVAEAAQDVHNHLKKGIKLKSCQPRTRNKSHLTLLKRKRTVNKDKSKITRSFNKYKAKTPRSQHPATLELAQKLHALELKIDQLVETYGKLRAKASWLTNVRETNKAYTRMYHLLKDHCRRQHEAHVVDFEVRRDFNAEQWRSDFNFRFSSPPSEGRIRAKETWLRYQAAPATIMERIDCLLDLELAATENNDATFACVEPARDSATTLTDLNWRLQYHGLVTEEDILQFAKKIASAVLSFNCTPWFRAFWTCDDVVMYASKAQIPNIYPLSDGFEPHFRVPLENDASQIDFEMMLWCLGLVLYDLWKYIPGSRDTYGLGRVRWDITTLQDDRRKIIVQTNKWVKRRQMPRRYGEILRWCLDAELGQGDMRDPGKMHEMWTTVVCGLDKVIEEERKRNAAVDFAQVAAA